MSPAISIGGSLFILIFPFLFLKQRDEIVFTMKRLATGVVLAVICGLFFSVLNLSSPLLTLLIVAFVEECGKLIAAATGINKRDEARKWLISGFAAATGFAFWEHILYVITPTSTALFLYRSLSAVLVHILLTLISVNLLLLTRNKIRCLIYPILLIPSILLHALFNSLAQNTFLFVQLSYPLFPGIIVFLLHRQLNHINKSTETR